MLPINDNPIAVNDAISTDEDTPINIPVLSNDTDVDDVLNASMIVVITSPAHGSYTINTTTGAVTFAPSLNFNGNDSFTYQVKDASGALSNTATVNIIVTPVNDAPVASPDLVTTPEEIPISIAVLANDFDVDNPLVPSSLSILAVPAHGSAVVDPITGTILYTPQTNFTGNDSFTYTLEDPAGAISIPATVIITVSPVNDLPVANPDVITTPEDVPVSIAVLANDTDVDNALDPSSLLVVTGPAHGSAVVQPATGTILYTPSKDFNGNDSFTYTVKDVEGGTSTAATVTITVLPVNDAPTTNPDLVTTPEEVPVSIPVLANDTDVDDALDVSSLLVVSGPAHGSAVVQGTTGEILYTPSQDFTGNDSFTYTVKDMQGATSATTTVTITVSPVNDAPVASPDVVTTPEDVAIAIDVLVNDIDVDNTLNGSSLFIVNGPANGTAAIKTTTGMILYTPKKDFIGNDSFTYTVTDAAGAASAPATVTIIVTPVNDVPVASPDAATTPEEIPVSIPVLANDTDVDNELDPSSLLVLKDPTHGSAVVQASTGEILYTPSKDFTGNDSFTYNVKDVQGGTSVAATVTIAVTPVNDPPVAVDDEATTNNNTPVKIDILANDFDVDSDIVTTSVTITANPVHGTRNF